MATQNTSQTGVVRVLERNAFYRDGYKKIVTIFLTLLALDGALFGLNVYIAFTPPAPEYFPSTSDGRIIEGHSLSDPIVTNDYVLQLSVDAMRHAMDLDYLHWRDQLESASQNFTPDGWTSFKTALQKTNNLKSLVAFNAVSNVTVTGSPQVVETAVVGGHYAWKIEVPIVWTYQADKDHTFNMPMRITMIVLRMAAEEYPQRVAINNLIADTISVNALSGGNS